MLTAKQRETYEFVRVSLANTGRAPTYREIANAMGTSSGGAYASITCICKRGWLLRSGRVLSVARHPPDPSITASFDYFAVDYLNLTNTGWPRLVDLGLT